MKEVMGRLKRDTDFMLPRACKRARSSVHHYKNASWEYSQRPRRSVSSMSEQQTFSGFSRVLDEPEEDLDEIAMALLEMSSPQQRGSSQVNGFHPPFTNSQSGLGPSKMPQNALQLQSNTLKAVPTIIITSGSSDSGFARSKSGSSDIAEGANSTGQTTSPLSHQESETVAFVNSRDSARSNDFSAANTMSMSCAASNRDPKQGLDAATTATTSLPIQDRPSSSTRIGHTVSTGISLPNITLLANKEVRQDTAPRPEEHGNIAAPPNAQTLNPTPDLQTQLMVQQILQGRLAAKAQSRPLANSRGGNLIVLASPSQKLSTGRSMSANLGECTQGRSQSPAGTSQQKQKETQQLTLTRVPTLVLSTNQKPSKPRQTSSRPQTSCPVSSSYTAPNVQARDSTHGPVQPARQIGQQILPGSDPATKGQAETTNAEPLKDTKCTAGNGASSGEESSEDDWLPNWSLNLYNALNPTVITTGQNYLGGRSTSQSLDGKALPAGR